MHFKRSSQHKWRRAPKTPREMSLRKLISRDGSIDDRSLRCAESYLSMRKFLWVLKCRASKVKICVEFSALTFYAQDLPASIISDEDGHAKSILSIARDSERRMPMTGRVPPPSQKFQLNGNRVPPPLPQFHAPPHATSENFIRHIIPRVTKIFISEYIKSRRWTKIDSRMMRHLMRYMRALSISLKKYAMYRFSTSPKPQNFTMQSRWSASCNSHIWESHYYYHHE